MWPFKICSLKTPYKPATQPSERRIASCWKSAESTLFNFMLNTPLDYLVKINFSDFVLSVALEINRITSSNLCKKTKILLKLCAFAVA